MDSRLWASVSLIGALSAVAALSAPITVQTQVPPPDAGKSAQQSPAPPKPETARPGRDRWLVKTASDPDAADINPDPVASTVEALLKLPRPVDLPYTESNPEFDSHRARPAEMTVWSVEADIVAVRSMPDGDYRVTIRGATGKTMVLEMPKPDPAFVSPTGKFAAGIKTAREQFDSKAKPEPTEKPLQLHARITGIGFFGRAYGKNPVIKDNLLQIHPVLKIAWLRDPSADFKKAAAAEKAKAAETAAPR